MAFHEQPTFENCGSEYEEATETNGAVPALDYRQYAPVGAFRRQPLHPCLGHRKARNAPPAKSGINRPSGRRLLNPLVLLRGNTAAADESS